MSFFESMKENADMTRTLNGAATHGSTGDACLDLFSVAGGMRYRNISEQTRLFTRAYIENPELAMKLLFHIRDIRGGMGEREMFRTLIRFVAKTWPESAIGNVALVREYGRWDDLMCLMGTKAEKEVVRCIREQLEKDLAALDARAMGQKDAPISLLAKWLPSDNASSARTRGQARVLMNALRLESADYRCRLTRLRAASCVAERRLTQKRADLLNYEALPAGAMLKYRAAFQRQDGERYRKYLEGVELGERGMHADTLFPYEILRPFFKGWRFESAEGADALEALWDSQAVNIAQQNAISVIDTSGSMYWCFNGAPKPALISQALGLYYAERCKGPFHNRFITFESRPHLIEIHGDTLEDKLRYIGTASWGGSTNIEAVFDLILQTALLTRCRQDEMPQALYIISDMEFNQAVENPDRTLYDVVRAKFEENGYQLPAVVFHNVNSWQMQAPVTAHTKGTALTSGAGTQAFREKFDGNVTPMSHMLRVLNGERYKPVHAYPPRKKP